MSKKEKTRNMEQKGFPGKMKVIEIMLCWRNMIGEIWPDAKEIKDGEK